MYKTDGFVSSIFIPDGAEVYAVIILHMQYVWLPYLVCWTVRPIAPSFTAEINLSTKLERVRCDNQMTICHYKSLLFLKVFL